MSQITKYKFILMLWIPIQTGFTASTVKFLPTTCTAQQQGDMDFRTINVTKKTGKKCTFNLENLKLHELSRDVILFDTARLNCKGRGAVKFPYSSPKKNYETMNYCNNTKGECMVYRRFLKTYPKEDVLGVVRGQFPNCISYVIRPKYARSIVVTPSTTALTLRYKLFSMPTATTTSSQVFALADDMDHSLTTVSQSLPQTDLETVTNIGQREKGLDTTTVPDVEKDTSSTLTTPVDVSQTKSEPVTDGKPTEQGEGTRAVPDEKTDITKAIQTDVPKDITVSYHESTSNQQPATTESLMSKLTGGQIAAIAVPPALGSLAIIASLIMSKRRNGIIHRHARIMSLDRKEETKVQPDQQITYM